MKRIDSVNKNDEDDEILVECKVRFVPRGFLEQIIGEPSLIQQQSKFSSGTARNEQLRSVIFAAAVWGLEEVFTLDIKKAFLSSDRYQVEETPYVEYPAEVEDEEWADICGYKKGTIMRVRIPLYGSRSASNRWNNTLDRVLKSIGLKNSASAPCMYYGEIKGNKIVLVIHVDDILVAGNKTVVEFLKVRVQQQFEIGSLESTLSKGGLILVGKILNQ